MKTNTSIYEWLVLGCLTAIGLLFIMYRIIQTGQLRFVFLSWNLVLAFIPLIFVQFLKPGGSKWIHGALITSWLLMFPNAPYIVTDLIHIRKSAPATFWFDFLLVCYFSVLGLLAGYYSFRKLSNFLKQEYQMELLNKRWMQAALFLLTGFGLYLGRILRWNSWDIIHQPNQLMDDIMKICVNPLENLYAWKFTFFFAFFIGLGYYVFNKLFNQINSRWTFIN
jgi:uncharacterized membrane protein